MLDEIHPSVESTEYLVDLYKRDNRPWVVAYSGGKDSTTVLQLVFDVLLSLGQDANKPVFVISSDTTVEAPVVVGYVTEVMDCVENTASKLGLPLSTQIVVPEVPERYWSKLIGLGYPSPTRWFRWCTTNMKIKPSRRAIDKITREYGSVVLLLGSRVDESDDRKRRMNARKLNSSELNVHHEIPNALVATPIKNWATDEVWEYLFENDPPPWGRSHDTLLTLYRQAAGGECPVVMDLDTPSCGGSRFGCWTCTVVRADKSMEGFIESGEEWMLPLNEFRNWLKEIREDPDFRQSRRRNGQAGPGPFNPKARILILDKLLKLETSIRDSGIEVELISDGEIAFIQNQWNRDFDIGSEAFELAKKHGRKFEQPAGDADQDEFDLVLERLLAANDVPEELVRGVLELQKEYPNLDERGVKTAIKRDIRELIEKAAARGESADGEK